MSREYRLFCLEELGVPSKCQFEKASLDKTIWNHLEDLASLLPNCWGEKVSKIWQETANAPNSLKACHGIQVLVHVFRQDSPLGRLQEHIALRLFWKLSLVQLWTRTLRTVLSKRGSGMLQLSYHTPIRGWLLSSWPCLLHRSIKDVTWFAPSQAAEEVCPNIAQSAADVVDTVKPESIVQWKEPESVEQRMM